MRLGGGDADWPPSTAGFRPIYRRISHAERIRVAPSGALAEDPRPICALERAREEERDVWELRPLVRGFEARLAA